ncbi:hypothetical protein DFH08DRAFT_815873 [Mycena albidolilacea]|uniref:Uncharacterized protein n=1 Tax=Mycena albidolilacea TaxID=1033008 RepID=A0AAD7EIH7_9AGAR|nr:hypothetical protein DFH08DRAFT_815873 [Mycena albidolilacea]
MCFRTMKTPTSEQLTSILLATIALIPDHGVRYTVLGLLLAAVILCTIHLQSPPMQLCQLTVSLNQTEEYLYSRGDGRGPPKLFRTQGPKALPLRAFSWKGFRSLSKDIGERITRFRSLSNEIGECIHCVKDIRTDIELILEAERQRNLAGDPAETPSTLAVI